MTLKGFTECYSTNIPSLHAFECCFYGHPATYRMNVLRWEDFEATEVYRGLESTGENTG
jgi:hypothetical protein